MADATVTLAQALSAQRALRDALGLGDEIFPLSAFVGMISDEIEQLRATGRSDAAIAAIVSEATGAPLDPHDLARFYAPPEDRRRPD